MDTQNKSDLNENYVIVEAQNQYTKEKKSVEKNNPKKEIIKPSHYRNNSSLVQLLGLTTKTMYHYLILA